MRLIGLYPSHLPDFRVDRECVDKPELRVDGQAQEIDLLSYCFFALLAQLASQNLLLKSEVIVTTNEFQNSFTFFQLNITRVAIFKTLDIKPGFSLKRVSDREPFLSINLPRSESLRSQRHKLW